MHTPLIDNEVETVQGCLRGLTPATVGLADTTGFDDWHPLCLPHAGLGFDQVCRLVPTLSPVSHPVGSAS